jgi:hypothetical protein
MEFRTAAINEKRKVFGKSTRYSFRYSRETAARQFAVSD